MFSHLMEGVEMREEDLVYAVYAQCPCSARMAYQPGFRYWECSDVLLGRANIYSKHESHVPFGFYDVKSENQPGANKRTMKPVSDEQIKAM